MKTTPPVVESFLSGHRFAVAGVSRSGKQPANAIYKKLKASGYEVVPVNPAAARVEDEVCYASVVDVPGPLDGVVVATPPSASIEVVRQCEEKGVEKVWFHRSVGDGSVSEEAVEECRRFGINAIVGGCPMMFCEPVDIAHRCMRWWFQRKGKVPA
jgi:hypothetical protein